MPALKNFVAVDWRSGKDKIYFFFKDSNTYSKFMIDGDRVLDGYPAPITYGNWKDFHVHARHLRFGFTTTALPPGSPLDEDTLWLFYYDGYWPMVSSYSQDEDKVVRTARLEDSDWAELLPYFDHIVAGTWWQRSGKMAQFRFLMNNGHFLTLDWNLSINGPYSGPLDFNHGIPEITVDPINNKTWPGLEPYKDRIITAVQNDRSFADSYYYIFLTNNEYITYNIGQNKVEYGPYKVTDVTWPGLLRD